jgi:RHS repeat-associated protein
MQTTDAGAISYEAAYEAGGKRVRESGSNPDPQRANTKDEDPTGYLNEGHRYRDLETGVWLTRDPAGFVDGPNLYAYVRQNPWSSFDPLGLQEYNWWAGGWLRTHMFDPVYNTVANIGSNPKTVTTGVGTGMATGMMELSDLVNPFGVAKRALGISQWEVNTVKNTVAGVVGVDPNSQVFKDAVTTGEILSPIPGGAAAKPAIGGAKALAKTIARDVASAPIKDATENAAKALVVHAEERFALLKKGKCFFAGTPVATPKGWKAIEDIKEGDIVYAFDEKTGKTTERHVTEVLRNHSYWWVDVSAGGETITATRTHRFWVVEQNGWKEAKSLRAGEHLRRFDGNVVEIESVRLWESSVLFPTFNLEVEGDHVFFVGKTSILVHNGDVEPHPLSPEGHLYRQPPNLPGSRLSGTDMDHALPRSTHPELATDPNNLRSMPGAMNQVDKARVDAELAREYRQLVNDLRTVGKTAEQAEAIAKEAMKEAFRANANSVPAHSMSPAEINKLCPAG